jgi:hypothetical protein
MCYGKPFRQQADGWEDDPGRADAVVPGKAGPAARQRRGARPGRAGRQKGLNPFETPSKPRRNNTPPPRYQRATNTLPAIWWVQGRAGGHECRMRNAEEGRKKKPPGQCSKPGTSSRGHYQHLLLLDPRQNICRIERLRRLGFGSRCASASTHAMYR